MIRIKLESFKGLHTLRFDIAKRKLTVYHHGNVDELSGLLSQLNLGSHLMSHERTGEPIHSEAVNHKERKTLWAV